MRALGGRLNFLVKSEGWSPTSSFMTEWKGAKSHPNGCGLIMQGARR
jgi:hypothetical protein